MLSLCLFFSTLVSQADLVMEINTTIWKMKLVVKIKGDKVRLDAVPDGGYGSTTRITDSKTGEDIVLDHVPKRIENGLAFLSQSNTAAEWPKLNNTGKTGILDGYETDIYNWTNSFGGIETLWVAKNYPNFNRIKSDLSKLVSQNNNKILPELKSLSGMPLKLVILENRSTTHALETSITLISAKEEPIEDSAFELPKNYNYYGLQSASVPNNGLFNAITATNLNQWKVAITNLQNDSTLKSNWVMQQSDTNAGVRLIISGTNQTWVEFDSNFISINTETNDNGIHRIELHGLGMNFPEIRVRGDALLKVMGKDEADFNAWCDMVQNHKTNVNLFSSGSSQLPNSNKYGEFQILNASNGKDPWVINFFITDP